MTEDVIPDVDGMTYAEALQRVEQLTSLEFRELRHIGNISGVAAFD